MNCGIDDAELFNVRCPTGDAGFLKTSRRCRKNMFSCETLSAHLIWSQDGATVSFEKNQLFDMWESAD